jgi:hypothetical protein
MRRTETSSLQDTVGIPALTRRDDDPNERICADRSVWALRNDFGSEYTQHQVTRPGSPGF